MTWFVEHLRRDGSVLSRVAVVGPTLRIGRALDNDLVLDDPHCAAHHACLRVQPDGSACLEDLGSLNGIFRLRGKTREKSVLITDEQALRLGQSQLRVRSSEWQVAPEKPLVSKSAWPWAIFALLLVLGYSAWSMWLSDLNEKSPPYLNELSGIAVLFGIWSAMYALLGRLINGVDRFFSHVLIASIGYLFGAVVIEALALLAFASGWLWPLQITPYALIGVAALVVRQHLQLADPRHWHATRWGVLVIALGSMLVPLGQSWISHRRLTDIQTMGEVAHPRWRLARPIASEAFVENTAKLKQRVDAERSQPSDEESLDSEYED